MTSYSDLYDAIERVNPDVVKTYEKDYGGIDEEMKKDLCTDEFERLMGINAKYYYCPSHEKDFFDDILWAMGEFYKKIGIITDSKAIIYLWETYSDMLDAGWLDGVSLNQLLLAFEGEYYNFINNTKTRLNDYIRIRDKKIKNKY